MDDDALLRQATAGEPQAFAKLVRIYQQPLLRFAERLLGEAETAEDIVQEAFFRIWRADVLIAANGTLRVYLFRTVHNLCRDHHRARRSLAPLDNACNLPAPLGEQPEERFQARVLSEALYQAVLALPEPQRAVFILSHYEGMSYRQIAEILECPAGTVASRKHQAMEALRRRLRLWTEREEH